MRLIGESVCDRLDDYDGEEQRDGEILCGHAHEAQELRCIRSALETDWSTYDVGIETSAGQNLRVRDAVYWQDPPKECAWQLRQAAGLGLLALSGGVQALPSRPEELYSVSGELDYGKPTYAKAQESTQAQSYREDKLVCDILVILVIAREALVDREEWVIEGHGNLAREEPAHVESRLQCVGVQIGVIKEVHG